MAPENLQEPQQEKQFWIDLLADSAPKMSPEVVKKYPKTNQQIIQKIT